MEPALEGQIGKYELRLKQYDNIDGTAELSMGAMFLGFALLGYLQSILPKDSLWMNGIPGLLFMYLILGPVMGAGYWSLKLIKRHVTYVRTGYVAFRATPKARGLTIAVALGVSAAVSGLMFLVLRHGGTDLPRFVLPSVMSLTYAFFVFRLSREHPWKRYLALLMALGTVGIALLTPGDWLAASRPVMLFVALIWFASSGTTLYLYIRRTQPAVPDAE